MTGPVLVFDGDCAFCTTSVRVLERWFSEGFRTVPYQWADLDRLGLTERECSDRVQWIGDAQSPRTTRQSGSRAVCAVLRTGGAARGGLLGRTSAAVGLVASVPPVSILAEAVYRLVAANRHRLPGGTPACRA